MKCRHVLFTKSIKESMENEKIRSRLWNGIDILRISILFSCTVRFRTEPEKSLTVVKFYEIFIFYCLSRPISIICHNFQKQFGSSFVERKSVEKVGRKKLFLFKHSAYQCFCFMKTFKEKLLQVSPSISLMKKSLEKIFVLWTWLIHQSQSQRNVVTGTSNRSTTSHKQKKKWRREGRTNFYDITNHSRNRVSCLFSLFNLPDWNWISLEKVIASRSCSSMAVNLNKTNLKIVLDFRIAAFGK